MRRMFTLLKRRIYALICVQLGLIGISTAQIEMKGNVRYSTGAHKNVYNSPVSYLNQGVLKTEDSLLANSMIHDFVGNIVFSQKGKKINWKAGAKMWNRTLPKAKNGNQSEYSLFYDVNLTPWKNWELGNELDAKRDRKLGINVLGDELLKSFNYSSLSDRISLTNKKIKKHKSTIYIDLTKKWYDSKLFQEGLSHHEMKLAYKASYDFSSDKNEKRKLTLIASLRNRAYSEWTNPELLKNVVLLHDPTPFIPFDSTRVYPLRKWRYKSVNITYVYSLSKGSKLKPYFEYNRRQDLSHGDFGYHAISYGIRAYFKSKKWDMNVRLSNSSRKYTDRLAEQNSGTPYPTLNYSYLRTKVNFKYQLHNRIYCFAELESVRRKSNTTNLAKRTRRTYANMIGLLGVSYDFQKTLRK